MFKKIRAAFANKERPVVRYIAKSANGGYHEINLTNLDAIFGICSTGYKVTYQEAYEFYNKVEPLNDAVTRIAGAVDSLPLVLKQVGADGEMVAEHPVIQDIRNPQTFFADTFLKELMISCLLTEESWIVMRGVKLDEPPVGMLSLRPYNASLDGSVYKDGLPERIRTDSPKDRRIYYLHNVDGNYRYFDSKSTNTITAELVPIIGVVEPDDQFRGMPRLSSIRKELEHIWHGNVHNSGLLENGMTIANVFAVKGEITNEDNYNRLQQAMKERKGVQNAGQDLVLPVQVEAVKNLMTNKDADYAVLTESAIARVYSLYQIPLPLIMPKIMTLNNYNTAQVSFYDNAVADACTQLFPGLYRAMSNRYRKSNPEVDEMFLSFNQHEVKALQQRQAERMETLRKTYALSNNEIRTSAGYTPLEGEEGDDIMMPATLVPIGDGINEI